MARILLSLGMAAAMLSSCGNSNTRDITEDVEALADRACLCKDADCARAVLKDLLTLGKNSDNTKGNKKRADKAGTRLVKCVAKSGLPPEEMMAVGKELSEL